MLNKRQFSRPRGNWLKHWKESAGWGKNYSGTIGSRDVVITL